MTPRTVLLVSDFSKDSLDYNAEENWLSSWPVIFPFGD